jgi:hypothetical protein
MSVSYLGANNQPYATDRDSARFFITEGVEMQTADTTFALPVVNGNMDLIQVVNPYLANLSFTRFRKANENEIENGYYIWDGDVNNGFAAVMPALQDGNRYITTDPTLLSSPDLIAPLQSFIVKKMPAAGTLLSLRMSPNWTTTSTAGTYTLRSANPIVSGGILRIKATQGNKMSYAAIVYQPGAPLSKGPEDMPPVVFEEPLTLYTLTPQREPLSINTSGYFDSAEIPLGLRVRDAGETKLEFFDQPTFGHEVYLIDREKGTLTNLRETPEYTFTIAKLPSSGSTELNDRFILRFYYSGDGIVTGNEALASPTLQVTSQDGYLYVRSNGGEITHLQVYNLLGNLVYETRAAAHQYKVKLNPSIYIIKSFINNYYKTEKVIVK